MNSYKYIIFYVSTKVTTKEKFIEIIQHKNKKKSKSIITKKSAKHKGRQQSEKDKQMHYNTNGKHFLNWQ